MPIEDYKDDLEEPPDDFLRERLELFGFEPGKFADVPSIVIEKQRKPVSINPREGFDPKRLGDVKRHSTVVEPDDLLALKELSGVPQRVFDNQQDRPKWESPRPAALRRRHDAIVAKLPQRVSVAKLSDERKEAVFAVAFDLLHGPVSDRMISREGYDKVVKVMLGLSKLTAFLSPDLVVADGQTVTFSNYAALYFNNVVVYGSGGIRLGHNTKLHAFSIKHL